MKFHAFTIFSLAFLSLCITALGSPPDSLDFYRSIKNMDLSSLWRSDSIHIMENEPEKQGKRIYYTTTTERFPEPLGFIGKEYQRFYIHYLTIKRDTGNHYMYQVTGKTKVKDSVRNFKGTIIVVKAKVCKEPTIMIVPGTDNKYTEAAFRQGVAVCDVKLVEDTAKPKTGTINGRMITRFYLDSAQHIFYDNLNTISGSYCNNQVMGAWKMNKADTMKRCNWGDYRIPNSGDLDEGIGGFSPADKYLENGWQNYRDANFGGPETPKSKKAAALENVRWWKL
jgi:hypothetical protein